MPIEHAEAARGGCATNRARVVGAVDAIEGIAKVKRLGTQRISNAPGHLLRQARVALAHLDVGTGDAAANQILAAELMPLVLPLLCAGAIIVSDPPLAAADLEALPLPHGVAPGRYHLYRRR